MSKPLGLTDSQYSAVVNACAPLAPADRSAFLGELAALLRNEPTIGDGTIDRAVRLCLRRYFRPPTSTSGPQSHRHVGPPIE
jgi:hypothetical protein